MAPGSIRVDELIYQRGDRYVIRYHDRDQLRRSHMVRVHPAGDLDAARAARDQIVARLESGLPLITSDRTVASCILDWECWIDERTGYQLMSDQAAAYRRLVNRWIRPLLGDCRLRELLPSLLTWFDGQVTPSSRNQVRKHLQKIVEFAVDEGEIAFNPITEYYPGRKRRTGPRRSAS